MVSLEMLGHGHCCVGNVLFGYSGLEDIHAADQKNLLSSGCLFLGNKANTCRVINMSYTLCILM